MGIEDKLDRYYDDVMTKIISSIEVQTRLVGENKELKKEVSRLREAVHSLQTDTEAILMKVKAIVLTAEGISAEGGRKESASSQSASTAEPPSPRPAKSADSEAEEPREVETRTPAAKARSLKEYLADGLSLYDVKVLNAFINATKEVIKANCRTQPNFLKPHIEEKIHVPIVVAGKMKLARDTGQGAMAIAFERKTIEMVARDMLFLPPEANISEGDCKDVTSELCNQVCGRSKILLRQHGYNFDISLPHVSADPSPDALLKVLSAPKLALSFEYNGKAFYVLFWG